MPKETALLLFSFLNVVASLVSSAGLKTTLALKKDCWLFQLDHEEENFSTLVRLTMGNDKYQVSLNSY